MAEFLLFLAVELVTVVSRHPRQRGEPVARVAVGVIVRSAAVGRAGKAQDVPVQVVAADGLVELGQGVYARLDTPEKVVVERVVLVGRRTVTPAQLGDVSGTLAGAEIIQCQ